MKSPRSPSTTPSRSVPGLRGIPNAFSARVGPKPSSSSARDIGGSSPLVAALRGSSEREAAI